VCFAILIVLVAERVAFGARLVFMVSLERNVLRTGLRMNKNNKKNARKARRKGIVGLTSVPMMADRKVVVMPYGQYATLAPAANNWLHTSFSGNSVYDPDATGGGTTAYMYAALSALYGRYRVLSSKITVDAVNLSTVPVVCSLLASTSLSPPTNVEYQVGARHMTRRFLAGSTGSAVYHHVATATTASVVGMPEAAVRSEDNYTALTGANPTDRWYWHLIFDNKYNAAAGSVGYEVRIEYTVEWSFPVNLSP